ncbi:importin-4 isoform X4 [Populus alba x Populus x berolinensis]|nr:importin-4 isoform X4 [Populus alba x Populus x berolinensis]
MSQSLELLADSVLDARNNDCQNASRVKQIKRLAKDPQKITGHWAKLSSSTQTPRQAISQLKASPWNTALLAQVSAWIILSNRVRIAALKAVGSFLEFTNDGDEVVKFRQFIPSILNVARQCLSSGDEDVAIIAFEIFDELIESPEPLLGDSVKSIVQFSLEVCSSQNLESNTRHQAIQIISWLAKYKYKSTDSVEDDDLAPDRAAAEVIDTMSLNLSKQGLGGIQNKWLEGLHHLHWVNLQSIYSLKSCPTMKVFFPCILNAIEDASDEVKEKSYYALAAFCEDMGEEILPFLDPLMQKLLSALQNSLSAIGSVASAAEQAFIPYSERVLELMKSFMVLTNDEDLRSRARATELVGIVAMSAGRVRMEPILPPFMEAAISGFGLEFSELWEYTHGFFSNVAEIMDDSFAQYLPHVVPLAFASCNLDDGSAVDIIESDDENINGFGGVSSDDEAHDEPRVRNISVRTGVLDEKAAATQALGLYALHTKSSYSPYLEETLRILVRHSGYFHEDVRLQAIIALKSILTAAHAIFQSQNDGPAKAREMLGETWLDSGL